MAIGAVITYFANEGISLIPGLLPEFLFYGGIGLTIIPIAVAVITLFLAFRGIAAEAAR